MLQTWEIPGEHAAGARCPTGCPIAVSFPFFSMTRVILESPSTDTRLARAAAWLAERSDARVMIIGATLEATAEVSRRAIELTARKASLGWERTTLSIHAASLAR